MVLGSHRKISRYSSFRLLKVTEEKNSMGKVSYQSSELDQVDA